MTRSTSGWWFAWHPVRLSDTDKVAWLRKVYREAWGSSKYYYSEESVF